MIQRSKCQIPQNLLPPALQTRCHDTASSSFLLLRMKVITLPLKENFTLSVCLGPLCLTSSRSEAHLAIVDIVHHISISGGIARNSEFQGAHRMGHHNGAGYITRVKKCLIGKTTALSRELSYLERGPIHQRVASLIPSHGTYIQVVVRLPIGAHIGGIQSMLINI